MSGDCIQTQYMQWSPEKYQQQTTSSTHSIVAACNRLLMQFATPFTATRRADPGFQKGGSDVTFVGFPQIIIIFKSRIRTGRPCHLSRSPPKTKHHQNDLRCKWISARQYATTTHNSSEITTIHLFSS